MKFHGVDIMPGNVFGEIFKIMTFGESHGKAIGVIVDGCPVGLELDESDVQKELSRRRPGQSAVTTQRQEEDKVELLSGVFKGKTTGTPIGMVIYNKDADSSKYEAIKGVFRPGHADYTYYKKFGFRDYRGGGRSSARETAARVAAGAVAKKLLSKFGIDVFAYTVEIAGIKAVKFSRKEIESNSVRAADSDAAKKMETAILKAKESEDSVGGIVEVRATGVPAGFGEPVFDRLDARIAYALMSLPATKGVEIGAGFEAARMKGSQDNDKMEFNAKTKTFDFKSNNAGGTLGGISNGADIVARVAIKPASSIAQKQVAFDEKGKKVNLKIEGRHDPCVVPRAVPIIEAMVALVLADFLLIQRTRRL